MTDQSTRAEEWAIQKEALLTASDWLNAYGLAGVSRRDGAYPKVTTLAREFESFGRHVKAAAESRAASAEAEVEKLKAELKEARDGWERWKGIHAGGNTVIRQLEASAYALRDRVAVLESALKPFAKAGELFPPRGPGDYDQLVYGPAAGPEYNLSGDDLRAARAALKEFTHV